jgi:isopentenyl-diphosphate Delta-isomerase
LIGEDEQEIFELLSTIFDDREKYVILHVSEGREVLKAARAEKPSVILLDSRFPDCSGHQVCRSIRSDPVTSWIPVLMLSSTAHTYAWKEAIDAGADDYLAKPFNAAVLVAKVEALLAVEQHDLLCSVVLVDEQGNNRFDKNNKLMVMEKTEAHRLGLLHKAISVFIFNDRNEVLLQKRAVEKYHSPGKWTNACCTHPRPNESPLKAAERRLQEEMGLVTRLSEVFSFTYKADVGNGLIEHEFDYVFIGKSNQDPHPDPLEVASWKWVAIATLTHELRRDPLAYTPWLNDSFAGVLEYKK